MRQTKEDYSKSKDSWDILNKEEIESINRGLKDFEEGRTPAHDTATGFHGQALNKLIWPVEALNNLKGIIDYPENRDTDREINKFAQLLTNNLSKNHDRPHLLSSSDH